MVTSLPLFEERLGRAEEAEVTEPALAGSSLNPVDFTAHRRLGSEKDVHGPVGIDLVAGLLGAKADPLSALDKGAGGYVIGRDGPELDDRHIRRHVQAVGLPAIQ